MFEIGDYIRRDCPGVMGHGSVGKVLKASTHCEEEFDDCYYVKITEGRNGMKKSEKHAWHYTRCTSTTPRTPDWEV